MDSHHTGSKEILSIQTNKVCILIKGNLPHRYSQNLGKDDEASSSVSIRCESDFSIFLNGDKIQSEKEIVTKPLFFEQQDYELLIEGLEDTGNISFWNDNINIRSNVSPVGKHNNLLSGILNFGNDIGYSDLVVLSEDKEILRVRIEIFPSKISYKEDYKSLIEDVISEVYNLVFDFFKRTYSELGVNPETKASPAEFFSIISKIFASFDKFLKFIIRNPYHTLETVREVLPAYKSRNLDGRSIKWIQNHPNCIKKAGKKYNVEKILTPQKKITYNTKENQFLKFILVSTQKKLKDFEDTYKKMRREIQEEIIIKLEQMVHSIDRTLNSTFLSEVSILSTTNLFSLVFSMAPGYREIYRYYLILQHGLSLTGNIFNLSLKDIAELYEYWCFIKLNRILKDKRYVLISPDILKIETNGVTVNLKKGAASKVKYLNTRNKEIIELSYNPSERKSPTGPQKPDNVLSIKKKGSSIYQYIFDAKYRIDPGTDSSDPERQTPGPKEDAINTMHRYRDAIVSDTSENGKFNFERSMFGAYVLFPYNNETEYKNHKFYKSIAKVNVGALPFLPSATNLVSDFIEELIEDSPDSAFERATLPLGIEEKLNSVDWKTKDVLIGSLPKSQFEKFLNTNFYLIPAEQINENNLPIHWIALYQSTTDYLESGIHYYGEVIRCFVKQDKKKRKYYRFDIKNWKELKSPIKVKEFGPPNNLSFTNIFLLQNSTIFPELFLRSEKEFRLYNEIKYRISAPQYVENPFGFTFNGTNLFFDNDNNKILVVKNHKILREISFNEFQKTPHTEFKHILAILQ